MMDKALYVNRPLLNSGDVRAWAKSQGFSSTLAPDDMHVTICFSKEPFDWSGIKPIGKQLTIRTPTDRSIEQFGDAVVLTFFSPALEGRHQAFINAGASFDFAAYQPHVTITYDGAPDDLEAVEPYAGKLSFGPEEFSGIVDDWQDGIEEDAVKRTLKGYNPDQPRDPNGQWAGDSGSYHVTLETSDEQLNEMFPKAGEEVDGLTVLSDVPNMSSIGSSIDNPEVLSGIREVRVSAFENQTPGMDDRRTKLAEAIRHSGTISPLIVVIDNKGPYILEGSHRWDALLSLGKKTIPAKVVLDIDTLAEKRILKMDPGSSDVHINTPNWKKPKKKLPIETAAKILKVDSDLGVVFGWAMVCDVAGDPYFDTQGDYIPQDVMLKAATSFMSDLRVGREMHVGEQKGQIVFAWPMTSEIAKAMGVDASMTGMMIGFKPDDRALLKKYQDGEYTGFSIGGMAKREKAAD